jgi:uncharacterized membrane protein
VILLLVRIDFIPEEYKLAFLNTYFGKIVTTFFISMVPVIELRGAIPFATAQGLELHLAVITAIIGNLVPVPFIILFIRKIFNFIRRHVPKLNNFVSKMEKRAAKKSDVVMKYAFWGLLILVAIPLPGTGAWTGALIAAMLDMRIKKAFPAIALGVVTSAIIVTIITYGVSALIL